MSKFSKAIIGLEIFAVGTHTDSGGSTNTFSDDDVDYMVNKFAGGFPEFVPIKLGHTSDEFNAQVAAQLGLPAAALNGENGEGFDGVAALGQVTNLYQEGDKLVADLKVPDEMANLFQQEYFRDVSCELSVDSEDRWILDGLAMLGAERPAVETLAGIAAAAVHKKREAVATRSFSQALPKKVNMSEEKTKIDKILSLVSGDKISLSELKDAGLKFGDETDKGAVKDAVRELQERSGMLDSVVDLLQQAIEITSTAAEEGDEIVEDDVAAEPAVAAKALVGRITTMLSAASGKDFKQGADFKTAVAEAVKESTKELSAQVAKLSGDSTVSSYRVETEKLVGMEGTAQDLAEQLAGIESKAGKETATAMLSSWKQVSTLNVESGQFKSVGQGEGEGEGAQGEPSDLEKEAIEFRKGNPAFSESQALSAVRLRRMRSVREAK